ncbi:2-phosphoxylose phosphatase 1 [Lucilia cuprina]|uniref:2-phosphoxylose phosphatase 1 n=1 Tax=Lucilia cuprina TaxID=7375 RepID=UPI001F0515E1|nr:2-phosphoxylose phosphatase 1 [Lucilia cuprina]
MFLKELIRFSTQHRTLYCYLILSIWIFLLIAGMYKYIGRSSSSLSYILNGKSQYYASVMTAAPSREASNFAKYKARCTSLSQINRLDDGGILDGWKLQGVLLVIRHGDRGPMSHVRNIPHLDCGITGDNLVNKYRSFLYNSTSVSGSNHMYWNKVGPFHSFPLLPLAEKECLLGQLTYKGIAQLLHVGETLHQIYAHPLGLWYKQSNSQYGKNVMNSTPYSTLLNSDEVVVYTTRVRRTFQSALALLYTFLPTDKWLALNVKESHSIAFCFSDCACPQADSLRKELIKMQKQRLTQQPMVANVMHWIGNQLLQHTPNGINDPNEVVDAMLTVMCHDAPWPCRNVNGSERTVVSTKANDVDLNDVINIDQDDMAIGEGGRVEDIASNLIELHNGNLEAPTATAEGCIESHHVSTLMSFSNWQSTREVHHAYYKRIGLMRAYGMIRHIVSYMLRMISGDRTKFVLYSGHDWTLQYLTAALGIQTDNTFIAYAARLAFEVYKSEAHTDYYFRVVYDGHDVTKQIDFCEGGKSLRVTRDSRGNKADLCPIENIIRFLHEDYFGPLNATNFKDACILQQQKPNEF